MLRITDFKFRKDGSGVKIVVDESSDRLQLLEPEVRWKKYYWKAKLLIRLWEMHQPHINGWTMVLPTRHLK
jgi:hypothetical protein